LTFDRFSERCWVCKRNIERISRRRSKAMAWFAIAERKSMRSGEEPSKISQITTNILIILNALNAKNFIIYNPHSGS
jgi:hypothetical protein